jgi:hypothetical protein
MRGNVLLTVKAVKVQGFAMVAVQANGLTVKAFWSEQAARSYALAAEAMGLGCFINGGAI